ncbi:MAG: hypothetical protein QOJ00_196 [Actinomycetota bacterium]
MGRALRVTGLWVATGALTAAALGACGRGNNVDADSPTTRHGGRFPAAVVEPSTPDVTNAFGVTAATTTTSTTRKPAVTPTVANANPTTTAVTTPTRTRPSPTPMPAPRTSVGATGWQGLVVVAGGTDASGHPSARVDSYDPATGAWTQAPGLPQAVSDVALGVLGDDLWAVGGFTAEGDQKIAQAATYRFHPGDKAWRAGPVLATPRGGAALGALNGQLVVLGGATTDGGTLDSVETLDLGASDWKLATPLTQKRAYASAIVGGGRIYAVGGRTEGVATALDSVESWKPGDPWRVEQPLVTKRSGAGASGLCVAGGENGDGTVGTVECIAARKWSTKFQMAVPRHGLAVVTLGGWLHAIGGGPTAGPSVNSSHEIFDLQ